EVLGPVEGVVPFPAVGGAITAASAEAVQDREEDGAFDGKLEVAIRQEFAEHVAAAGFAPESLEDQRGTEAARGDDGKLAVVVGGEQEQGLGQACAGSEEGVQLAGALELDEAT